ncbi:MAG: DUF1778 domain-containing protein [Saprospiraceae bacterium]|nr:DUF1778 domain-containing protein [Saprospiraceae bacterium]
METNNLKVEKARFEAEKAAFLAGFSSLTDFVIFTLQNKSDEIIKDNEQISLSQKDKQIFFDALANDSLPNNYLKKALQEYNSLINQ